MKNPIIIFIVLFFLSALSTLSYGGRDIIINSYKSKGEVTLVIIGSNIDAISQVVIQRGTNTGEMLRQIKILTPADLEKLKTAPVNVVDKFPLSGAEGAFYKAVVTYKEGFERIYPATETVIDTSYTK